jgi:hypothetical protein
MAWGGEVKQEEKEEKKPIVFKSLTDADERRGLKVGIYGDYATGKTHFALTAKEPIFIIDTEMGVAPLAHIFKDKDIRILDVAEKDGTKSYEKIVEAVDLIAHEKEVGTVILDSITDFWDFCQEYAKVSIFKLKPEQRLAQQWDWGVINKLYMTTLMKLIKLPCNLIVTAREAEIYAGAGQPTTQVKPKWQKTTGFWVDFVIHNTKKIDKIGKLAFTGNIEKSRPSSKLMNKSYTNLDFAPLESELNKVKEDG